MQLYGYDRETNPLLSKLKPEMTIFNNVISPNVHTIVALDKILTQSSFEHPYKKENTSIVQLANEAGFSTYWISNQRPVGLHESVPTLIGSAADSTYFLNTNNAQDIIYDEIVLPTLDNVLNEQDKKKIVFIHLIGTHGSYDKRYPKTFNYFKDKNLNGKSLSETKVQKIN
jgi:heptose-I-phosphate ethanolaminephosphotransferase